jgi:hypothetical protein
MELIRNIPFELEVPALLEKVRIDPESDDARDIEDLAQSARAVADPKAVYEASGVEPGKGDTVHMNGVTFESRVLRALTVKAGQAFPFIITCGNELDGIVLPPDDFLKHFWLDSIKQLALQAAVNHFTRHIQEKYGFDQVSSMSPGSGSGDLWPIEQQATLFSIFKDTGALMGVRLTDSFLMIPNKTVSGVLFPTETRFENCQLCTREKCTERKAAFDQDLWDAFHRDNPQI